MIKNNAEDKEDYEAAEKREKENNPRIPYERVRKELRLDDEE